MKRTEFEEATHQWNRDQAAITSKLFDEQQVILKRMAERAEREQVLIAAEGRVLFFMTAIALVLAVVAMVLR